MYFLAHNSFHCEWPGCSSQVLLLAVLLLFYIQNIALDEACLFGPEASVQRGARKVSFRGARKSL